MSLLNKRSRRRLTQAELQEFLLNAPKGGHQEGRFKVFSANQTWLFFFTAGKLFWADGGHNPRRRLQCRTYELQRTTGNNSLGSVAKIPESEARSGGAYGYLIDFCQQQSIASQQLRISVAAAITDVLFEIWLESQGNPEWKQLFMVQWEDDIALSHRERAMANHIAIPVTEALDRAEQAWRAWQQAELPDTYLGAIPRIQQPDRLRESVPPTTYKGMMAAIDGQRSLQEVAAICGLRLEQLAALLLPSIRQGIILMDMTSNATSERSLETAAPSLEAFAYSTPSRRTQSEIARPSAAMPKIAYIDDSEQSCKLVGWFLQEAGYRYCYSTDPLAALGVLMHEKPDLILLDLVMPQISGYELCASISRISELKDTPIAIVTGRDGMVDRMRAKLAGASSFIAKPLQRETVLSVARKYLSVPVLQ